jgi:hypothetical protein
VADVAGARRGAGPCAVAGAGVAHHRRVDLDLTLGAEDRLGELEVEPHERVVAAPGARDRPGGLPAAEERLEDVLETEPGTEPTTGATTGRGRVDTHVVLLALVRVGQHLVGARDILEPVLAHVARHVWVQLAGQLAICLLDLLGRGVARNTEDLVVVGHRSLS